MYEMSIQYLAGIFDGEGSVSINKCNLARYKYQNPRYSVRVMVGMSDSRPIAEFKRRFGGYFVRRTNHGKNCVMWNWTIAGNKIIKDFFDEIMPYLVVKRLQAELAYSFLLNRKTPARRSAGLSVDEVAWRESVYQQLKALNRGQAPATTERVDPARGCDSLNSQATAREESEVVLPPSRMMVIKK